MLAAFDVSKYKDVKENRKSFTIPGLFVFSEVTAHPIS